MTARIGLGTAQFGSDYGVTNETGICPPGDVARILSHAARAGLDVIDTAAAYGTAEKILGGLLAGDHGFRIVTKVIPGGDGADGERAIRSSVDESMRNLRQNSLHGLIFHSPRPLLGKTGDRLWRCVSDLRDQGLVAKIGVSVRNPGEVDSLLQRYPMDIAQVPFNLFDQRMLSGGQLERLKNNAVEVHARSVFLQGLLLARPETLPDALGAARPPIEYLRQNLGESTSEIMKTALDFVLSRDEIDCAIVGVTSYAEFEEILEMAGRPCESPVDASTFAVDDIAIIDPTRWPQSIIHRERRQLAEAVGGVR